MIELHDATSLGIAVVEMADRIKRMNPIVPGTAAYQMVKIDGDSFKVEVSLHMCGQREGVK